MDNLILEQLGVNLELGLIGKYISKDIIEFIKKCSIKPLLKFKNNEKYDIFNYNKVYDLVKLGVFEKEQQKFFPNFIFYTTIRIISKNTRIIVVYTFHLVVFFNSYSR